MDFFPRFQDPLEQKKFENNLKRPYEGWKNIF